MMDFFTKAMGEVSETQITETPQMPRFFEEQPESQDDWDTPVATIDSEAQARFAETSEPHSCSGEELLSAAQLNPETLMDHLTSADDAIQLRILCDQISDSANRFDEIPSPGGLLPEYQRLMHEHGYESETEMCNAEGLNWDEIYDNEASFYGDEYKKGFIDSINQDMSPYTISEDKYNEAYYRGIIDAHLLRELMI